MQLGIRAHDLGNYPFEELIKEIKDQGFSCTHMALYKSIKEFPVEDGALTSGLGMYMKRVFQENKVDLAVLGCYKNLANPDREQLKRIIGNYEANIRLASFIGVGVVGTETGAVNTEYQYEPANHTEEALNIFIHNLKPIVEYAEKMGVIFAIEPVWKHIVCDNKRLKVVLDEINSPNLQVILDPVNLLYEGNYERQTEIVEEAFELYGEKITVLHAKDFVIRDGKLISVAAGKGNLNYDPIMKYIKSKKPFIHVTLEDARGEDIQKSRQYILEKYNQA